MSDAEQAIRILLVEDNLVVQQYMTAALATHARNQIVAVLDDGLRAAEQACQLRPDIILLDLFLPGIDGIDVIRRVMNQCPCPIVVISAELDCEDRDLAFEAQRAGAVSVLSKPQGMEEHDFASFSNRLCRTVEMMAKVKVVRRWFDQQPAPGSAPKTMINPAMLRLDCDVLLIGSSTGGPAALYKILESLGPDFPFSVLIAQHIAAGFIDTLCSWLGKTGCSIKPGAEGEELLPGHVYIAPDEKHLVIGADGLLHIVECRQASFTPSVDMLFSSVAEYYCGRVCAMILTGMGDDGTQGMTRLFDNGAFTIAQAESSCVIFGMPKMAINAGVVKAILTLEEICHLLAKR